MIWVLIMTVFVLTSWESYLQVDVVVRGQEYHLSWCHDGGRTYSWEGAERYCDQLGGGFHLVSLETQDEDAFVTNIIQSRKYANRMAAPSTQ